MPRNVPTKKAAKKAAARRAAKLNPPKATTAPVKETPKFNKRLFEENQKLHKTSAAIAADARVAEKLMERKRWSNG